ncbi:cell wall protein DAN4-like [Haliotis rubra]|uniref:cell wall protein DAN4-like n=1 Tax=Haliotis rubra TaxID=36100 RepID=UPI001EE51009|nr:cell wall protein DAN4-like [Haliotis rubra]
MITDPTNSGTVGTRTVTNPTTPATASITMATDPTSPPTAYITMATNPTITPSITMATDPTSLFTTSITLTTESIIPATTSITMATDSTSPTAASITMETTATYPASRLTGTSLPTTGEAPSSAATGTASSTAQGVTSTPTAPSQTTTFSTTAVATFVGGSSGIRDICPCLVCVETKSMIETQRFVDAILLLLKLDKSKLSATRRKLKSEPDDRPSAQAIGYSGIIFIVITFSFFVLNDLMRLCQLWSGRNTQIPIRNKTA